MAPSPVPDTTTGTGWDGTVAGGGVLIYNSGTGNIDIGSNGIVDLIGSPAAPRYQNILFFQDHSSPANKGSKAHQIGGGGALNLKGTIYLTNTVANMTATTYQELNLKGNSGSGTLLQGQIIVDALSVGGTGGIKMNLNSNSALIVRQVALVN
jgi:hypothetical protein